MKLILLLLILLLIPVLLWGAKRVIKRESVTRLGRGLFSVFSWVFGFGLFVALFCLILGTKLGALPALVAFFILFVYSFKENQKTDFDEEALEYSALKTFKKPIRIFSGFGFILCAGLWVWVGFSMWN